MPQSLHIGLLELTPGWEMILDGLGIPWRLIHGVGEPSPEEFAVIVVNRRIWCEEAGALEAYARAGGALLDVGRLTPVRNPWLVRRSWSHRIVDPSLRRSGALPQILDTGCRALRYTPPSRDGEEHSGTDRVISLEPLGAGTLAFLGLQPDHLLLSTASRTKRFPGLAGDHPAELVSAVDKGEVVRLVDALLRQLYHERGLPYVRKRRFPGDAPSILAFRIDTDYGRREQIDQLYSISRSSGIPFTWFLHTEGHDDWLGRFGEFEIGELALHCARHRTFGDIQRNLENIERGRRQMLAAGLPDPVGFSAPTGLWNHALAEGIDRTGFLYSSEFSLAFDALPFYPVLPISRRVNERFYRALQIPIHPISVANLARVRIDDRDMGSYYRRVIREKMAADMPLIFYHHPTHERYGVVEEILEGGAATGAQPMTFTDYALWWKRRAEARIDLRIENGHVVLHSSDRDPTVQIAVGYPDGTEGTIWMDGEYTREDITRSPPRQWTPPDEAYGPGDISRLRNFSPTVTRRGVQDWWRRVRR